MATIAKETKDQVFADYDSDADVLYISYGKPRRGYGDSRDDGIVLRYSEIDNTAIGVTVIGYKSLQWDVRKEELSENIADHLNVDRSQVLKSLIAIAN